MNFVESSSHSILAKRTTSSRFPLWTPLNPDFYRGVCVTSTTPLPPRPWWAGLWLVLWEAMLVVGLGSGFVVIFQLSVLVQRRL